MSAAVVPSADNIVWIDLEMTGLDVNRDRILEIGCIITDKDLNILARGPGIAIHESEEVLAGMNDWCQSNHAKTGLIQAVRDSKIGLAQAEQLVLDVVKKYCPEKACPLAGCTVHMDRMFLWRYMPRLLEYLHFRTVDITTVKELCKRWNIKVFRACPRNKDAHRALDDVEESIQHMRYFKQKMF
ncbi:oligoribonuclease, mitochondrial-like [Aedes albopictus]|uniref:Exonuclease domain-containing protein n=1 Tax=Aedes albopictus TaxID=7160 RepID=A0ABM1XQX0_AEDAL